MSQLNYQRHSILQSDNMKDQRTEYNGIMEMTKLQSGVKEEEEVREVRFRLSSAARDPGFGILDGSSICSPQPLQFALKLETQAIPLHM